MEKFLIIGPASWAIVDKVTALEKLAANSVGMTLKHNPTQSLRYCFGPYRPLVGSIALYNYLSRSLARDSHMDETLLEELGLVYEEASVYVGTGADMKSFAKNGDELFRLQPLE